ncbi:MAG: exodeoxyribonuclease VII small subunit [Proteobacteria bacterium]|nr:exodeoxyribonuclease VII small subunit [Pseudomonadota bacterium]
MDRDSIARRGATSTTGGGSQARSARAPALQSLPLAASESPHVARNSKIPDFEQSLAELESLVERLERGDLPLDEALRNFERGVSLTRQCQAALQAAQQRVEILMNRDGSEQAVPFEAAAGESDDSPQPTPES